MSPKPDQHDGRKLRGFTIVELLIVIAVIILLLSIVIVAVNAATRTAQSANTLTLMNSMKQALVRFKADIGYYPPVFGPPPGPGFGGSSPDFLRQLFPPPDPASLGYADDVQDWWSSAAMAEYLLGYGNHEQDGYGIVPSNPLIRDWDQETPPTGFRHPGRDGVWGATLNGSMTGTLDDRMLQGVGPGAIHGSEPAPFGIDQGMVYGPYLELKDERLIAGVMYPGGTLQTYFPGDAIPGGLSFEDLPKAIVDYWGQPIRYFRQVYRSGDIRSVYRSLDPNVPTPTLADVFVLRPFDLKPGSAIDGIADNSLIVQGGDTTTTHALRTAEFALVSAGPDRALDATTRYDAPDQNGNDPDGDGISFENKDNIVELGP
ncbi:MAG: type II secretion system protein [Planctomycetes bacterium]|nr:type II secretion system protein [Planctomycetota bacterium]